MKTKIYSMMLILVAFIGMSQGVMAKKVVYLGHQYKGDVNKENEIDDPTHSYYASDNDWRIVYPNGDVLEPKNEDIILHLKDKDYFFVIYGNALNIKDVVNGKQQRLTLQERGSFKVGCFKCRDISDDALNQIITTTFLPMFDIPETNAALTFYRSYDLETLRTEEGEHYLSNYYKGKYITHSEEKKEKEKTLTADRNKFKAKYGFDPINGTAFKVGKTIAIVDAWNSWLKSHGYVGFTFKLTQDHGASKCFRYFSNGKQIGSFWTKNNVITSITRY